MPDLTITDPTVEPRSPALALCDVNGCGEPATYGYVWAWGESGFCCGRHAAALRQTSDNLNRTITLSPLAPAAAVPMNHDERVRMTAEVLTFKAETEEVRRRNLELYNANVELRREISRQAGEVAELRGALEDTRAEAEQLTAEKMSALQDLAERTSELVRLEGILHAAETAPG